jgi:hypothetical protein
VASFSVSDVERFGLALTMGVQLQFFFSVPAAFGGTRSLTFLADTSHPI